MRWRGCAREGEACIEDDFEVIHDGIIMDLDILLYSIL